MNFKIIFSSQFNLKIQTDSIKLNLTAIYLVFNAMNCLQKIIKRTHLIIRYLVYLLLCNPNPLNIKNPQRFVSSQLTQWEFYMGQPENK
jgi:hypothetical protein